MFEKLFPNRDLRIIEGKLEESGTSHLDGREKEGAQRWVRVNGQIITRVSDGLYHAQWDDTMAVVCDKNGYMVGYWNFTKESGSEPNYSAAIGASSLVAIIVIASMLSPVWNYMWKGEVFKDRWWLTATIISIFGLYGFIWTPIYSVIQVQRERAAHVLLNEHRMAQGK
jgi:hypothetical protein